MGDLKQYGFLVFLLIILALGGCSSSSSTSSPSTAQSVEQESTTQDDPLVRQTHAGAVRGIETTYETWAWLGIPYAKPPLGDLRWRAPRDPDPWDGIRNAQGFCSYCVQYGNYLSETGPKTLGTLLGDGVPTGSEDCLYLNLWRPRSDATKLPVYVFIYGGGNILGRSDLSIYDGARFAARNNMIFLTMNYRLGYFGWFWHPSLKDGDDPLDNSGNYGTLDIIKSLQWIQNNITAFGGDPANVTITGQSAGGMNVLSMLASPLAKGLFHKAIVHSGFNQACSMTTVEQKAGVTLARLLKQDGISSDVLPDAAATRAYLRSKTVEEIYAPANGGPTGMPLEGLLTPGAIMGIYIDGTVLPASPLDCLRAGTYNRVPLMLGCTKEELKLFIPLLIMQPKKLWQCVQDFDPDHPEVFDLTPYLDAFTYPLMTLYTVLPAIGQTVFQGYGTDTMAPLAKQYQDDVYVYKFLWDDEPAPFGYIIGAGHAMDLPFVFDTFSNDVSNLTRFAWSEANREGRAYISEAMMTYLGQFARTGNPNGADPDLPLWTPWSNECGKPKRMTFNSDSIAMSSAYIEPEEVCITCEAQDLMNIINALIKGLMDLE